MPASQQQVKKVDPNRTKKSSTQAAKVGKRRSGVSSRSVFPRLTRSQVPRPEIDSPASRAHPSVCTKGDIGAATVATGRHR